MSDSSLNDLVALVEKHYADPSTGPLWLARLGQLLGDERKSLVQEYGILAGAVRAAGPERLDLVSEPRRHGRIAVVTPQARDRVVAQLSRDETSTSGAAFTNLPLPLQIAFCLRTEAHEGVAVRTASPVKYEKLGEGRDPSPGFLLIDEQYRSPGLKLPAASPDDQERLWRNFLAWAKQKNLDPDLLQRRSSPANALERFMAAQDADVVARMKIPGDIVALLLRHA